MAFRLTVEPLGETIDVREGQTMLDACLRAGIWLPHACVHGLCGTCKIDVLEGEVNHNGSSLFALMDYERDEGRALACVATLNSDTAIEAEIDDDPDAVRFEVTDFEATVDRTEMLTGDILGLWLEVLDESLRFQAGQYVLLEVPGIVGSRAFSVASAPARSALLELHVRLVEGGQVTTWLHQNAVPGLRLKLSGPYGRFYVRASEARPKLFLAGGSGLSSPKSMILDLLDKGDPHPITLFHGARTAADLYDVELFARLASERDDFTYVPVISGDDPDWKGERGFVHEACSRHFNGQFEGLQAYLCGPPLMIDACLTTLMRGRLFEKFIFYEKFLTSADGEQKRSPLFRKI